MKYCCGVIHENTRSTPSPRRMISLVMEKNIKKSPRAVFDLIDGIIFECMERKSKMKINFKMVG